VRPFETLDTATTPEGRQLALHRRGTDLFLYLDGEELMSTRVHGSEVALAELAAAELGERRAPRVLIGGLGLGFTLRSALGAFPPAARLEVVELLEAVVRWNRQYTGELGAALSDRRVRVWEGDVVERLRGGPAGSWDAILLDVDNGPSAWCVESNGRLYGRRGLAALRDALAPGGVLAVWSAYPDDGFVARLERAGLRARAEAVRGRGRKGPRQTVFLARR